MTVLMQNVSTNSKSAPVAHSGPCTVHTRGVYDGAQVIVRSSTTPNSHDMTPVGKDAALSAPGGVNVDIQGDYYIETEVVRAGAKTSLTVESTQ